MDTDWSAHRFSGGKLALDFANTVVCRDDSKRRRDRLANAADISSFMAAALRFRADEVKAAASAPEADFEPLIALRERVNSYFQPGAAESREAADRLGALLTELGGAISGGDAAGPRHQIALSAFNLLTGGKGERIGKCPNCGWLFLDMSRNGSRIWCDMAVCGNRRKAWLSYSRTRSLARKIGEQS
jgi:predicted RNA-binding Zn ribbon-like protein